MKITTKPSARASTKAAPRAMDRKTSSAPAKAPTVAVTDERRNVTISLNAELSRIAAAQAKREGVSFSSVIGELLAGWLEGRFELSEN